MGAEKKYLVVIAGPTAAGKTELAVALAAHYDSVILSADSRQFYRQMNIGTAKPDAAQLSRVKHYFINNKDVGQLYGAGHYEKDAIELLGELYKKHQVIFLVGGSGLYIDAVLNGVDEFEEVPAEIREALNKAYKEKGLAWLQEEIRKRDPAYASRADMNNPQRLIRALEVCIHSGRPFSSFLQLRSRERNFIPIRIMVNMPRADLYKRIDDRVDRMMDEGLLEEVKGLMPYREENALKTVGYKELYEYLDNRTRLAEAVKKIKQHTRNYAKRQITWFRNRDKFTEFSPGEIQKIISFIDDKIQNG